MKIKTGEDITIKEFFKRWKKGIKTLSITKQLKGKIIGHYFTILGFALGFGIMIYRGSWYFIILGAALVWLQIIELIGSYQQYDQAKKFEEVQNEAGNL